MFQDLIGVYITIVKMQFALVHLDEIVMFSKSPNAPNMNVGRVTRLSSDARLMRSFIKIEFITNRTNQLGNVFAKDPGILRTND